MLKRYYQVFGSLLIFSDACGLVVAWLLSYYLRFYTQIVPVTKGIPPFSRYVALLVPVVLLWWVVFSFFRLYGSTKIMRRTTELGRVLKAQATAVLLFLALTSVVTDYRFSRVVIGYFAVLSGLYLLGTRLALRNLLRKWIEKGHSRRGVVVAGTGGAALAFVQKMQKMPELGLKLEGFLSVDGGANLDLPAPVVGSYEAALASLSKLSVQDVVLAMPRAEAVYQDLLLKVLGDSAYTLHLVPDLHDYLTLGCTVEDFDQMPMLALNEAPIDNVGSVVKRTIDFIGSFLALALFSPLFFVLALLVKITSKGPVFYGQLRMSTDGTKFKMWKFRSMRVDAEKETGAVWAKKGDDRRTAIGSFLRSTSLDEIPQFWNVLVGEMSLVGPRPERPEFVEQFQTKIPRYMLRHKVKAGITGWAQVNGWRGDTSLERRIECDLYYIRNWSIALDFKILLLTPLKGFVNKNAY